MKVSESHVCFELSFDNISQNIKWFYNQKAIQAMVQHILEKITTRKVNRSLKYMPAPEQIINTASHIIYGELFSNNNIYYAIK